MAKKKRKYGNSTIYFKEIQNETHENKLLYTHQNDRNVKDRKCQALGRIWKNWNSYTGM